MYNTLENLCNERGITITKLCVQVTGSSGNLSTWKKGYMRSDYLKKAAEILNVSTDYLLGMSEHQTSVTVGDVQGSNNTIQNGNNNVAGSSDDFFNNPAVTKAYTRLSEREKLQVMMYILDVAEKSETPNGVVKIIEKASPDSTEEA